MRVDENEFFNNLLMLLLLVVLQALQVTILWVHDWVPLGNLNNVDAVRAADSTMRLVRVTLSP